MYLVLKNIFSRILKNKGFMFTPFIILPILVVAVLTLTQFMDAKPMIAVVGKKITNELEQIQVVELETSPPISTLFEGTYDAIVIYTGDTYEIKSVKNSQHTQVIDAVLSGKSIPQYTSEKRGVYTQFIGISSMFLFLFGTLLFQFYHDEKKGINARILTAPLSLVSYVNAHVITVFSMIFFPTMLALYVGGILGNVSSAMQFWQLIILLASFSVFVATFGFLLASIFTSDEEALTFSMIFAVFSSLLTGSFAPVTQNAVISIFSKVLPQHYFLQFAMNIENNGHMQLGGLVYVLFLSIVCILIGAYFTKRKLTLN